MIGNTLTIGEDKYELIQIDKYNSYAFSKLFRCEDRVVIIDYNVCDDKDVFSYQEYTNRQNKYVYQYSSVWRFFFEETLDEKTITKIINSNEYSDEYGKYRTRGGIADNSVAEDGFEKAYIELFGFENIGKLQKEYAINDENGNSYILDFYIESAKEKIAIEVNGVSYHHPQIIKEKSYKHQLLKQNVCTNNNIKLYRFSTEDLAFKDRLLADMNSFLKEVVSEAREKVLKGQRKFELYNHQVENLELIDEKRRQGIKTFLVVLPTASGKSKIIEEDLKRISTKMNVLVIAPTKTIVEDWKNRLASGFIHNILVCTYNKIQRDFNVYSSDFFDYIVVDEAHHAVAPMLKKVLQYFDPKFMIGLTATDKRLDNKKLEEVFGQYETKLTLMEAMEQGIVSRARVYRVETNIDLSEVRFNGKDYVNADLEKTIRVDSRNELIADVLDKYFNSGNDHQQGIVFCVNIDHAKEMARILNEHNISSSAIASTMKNNEKIIEDFKNKKIRFLCSCNMINEGWDYPELEILVMARPTMSKVLYMQQIGRGLRKAANKDCVYIIDVVDSYGALAIPWSINSLLKIKDYVPFGDPLVKYTTGGFVEVNGLVERIQSIREIDVLTFEDKYGDYLSAQQLSIELFMNDSTIYNWLREGKITADLSSKFGNSRLYLFSPENVEKIKKEKNIGVHDKSTIKKDFYDFLEAKDYSFSFKMVFMLSFLKHMDANGLANIDDVLKDYIRFYRQRLDAGYKVDRDNCVLSKDKLENLQYMKKSLLTNPFEKYERKRFIFYSKDLSQLALSTDLLNALTKDEINNLILTYKSHLEEYYADKDGLCNIDYLVGDQL